MVLLYGIGKHSKLFLREINDKWYYFHSDGSMAANTWIGNCYVNNSGEWVEDIETSDYIWPCPGYTTITSDYGYREPQQQEPLLIIKELILEHPMVLKLCLSAMEEY